MLVGQVVDVDLLLGLLQLRRSDMAAPSETREQAESREPRGVSYGGGAADVESRPAMGGRLV